MTAITAHPLFPAIELLSRTFDTADKESSKLLVELPAILENYFGSSRGTCGTIMDQYMEKMLFVLMQHFIDLARVARIEKLDNMNSDVQAASKRRPNHSTHVRKLLLMWLEEHKDHPFPTGDEKKILMEKTGLDLKQLDNWFINARRRY
ncbi:putative HD-1 (homeodomain) [Paramicrosporidium saccamoebae]|uniref:Putative HD-1 (Homeodomain) n=1 Tax=Paramicrosporidium saccamoebae TaxID=1246581 RepID=A0A2H9TKG5_9FUNG|nr:putative HD-1 (homeodomain) [Paramicrosporidium saccamoebae]